MHFLPLRRISEFLSGLLEMEITENHNFIVLVCSDKDIELNDDGIVLTVPYKDTEEEDGS